MQPLVQFIDQYLIIFYRLTKHAGVDFIIGTFFLAFFSLLIGKATVALVFWLTSKRLDQRAEEAANYHYLAIDALKAGDKEAYTAINKLANEAFGHTFFQQAALSAAFLWPVFFALDWMQDRFLEVSFPIPGTGWSLGYIGAFIIIYILTYFLMKQAKRLFSLFIPTAVMPAAVPDHKGLVPLLPPKKKTSEE